MKFYSLLKNFILFSILSIFLFSSLSKASQPSNLEDFTKYGINPSALGMAFKAYHWALHHGQVSNPRLLTLIDMTKANKDKRLYVLDLKSKKVLMTLAVTNGKNSGTYYSTCFSNQPGSLKTSLGTYVTADPYNGEHGFSLRIHGLEKGINDNAYNRAIVIHAAWYASPEFIETYGRTGASWGCFAVDPSKIRKLIHLIQGGTVLFTYARDENHDPYLAMND